MKRLLAIFIIFVSMGAGPVSAQGEDPRVVMQDFIDDMNTLWVPLNRQEGAPYETRRAWTQDLINTRFDFPHMSRSSLGTLWRTLSAADQATYNELFYAVLVETVIDWLDGYDGQVFEILSLRNAGRNTEIVTRFEQSDGRVVRVTWVTRNTDGVYLFRDVRVSGISLTADFRGRHQDALNKRGAEGLFESLEEATEQLRARQQ